MRNRFACGVTRSRGMRASSGCAVALGTLALGMAALVTLPSCTAKRIDNSEPAPDLANVALSWSIEGSKDPLRCLRAGASQIQLVYSQAPDRVWATEYAPCDQFRVLSLVRGGTYTVTATLLDGNGDPVSSTVDVGFIDAAADTTAQGVVDFPQATIQAPPL